MGPSGTGFWRCHPRFELEGSTLTGFLAWVSRETGWKHRNVGARRNRPMPEDVTLHGSIEELRPDEALEAVLPTCNLRHAVNGGIVLIDIDS